MTVCVVRSSRYSTSDLLRVDEFTVQWASLVATGCDAARLVGLLGRGGSIFEVSQFDNLLMTSVVIVVVLYMFWATVSYGFQLGSDQSFGQVGIGSVGQSRGVADEPFQDWDIRIDGCPVPVDYVKCLAGIWAVSGNKCGFTVFGCTLCFVVLGFSALPVLVENLICLSHLFTFVLLYPLLAKFLLCWSIILENCLGSEFVCRYLMASPMANPLPVLGGWYESSLMYSCLFVGLMCVLVCNSVVSFCLVSL